MTDKDLKEIQEMILAFLKWGPVTLMFAGVIASIIGSIINPCLENIVAIFLFAIPLVIALAIYPLFFK